MNLDKMRIEAVKELERNGYKFKNVTENNISEWKWVRINTCIEQQIPPGPPNYSQLKDISTGQPLDYMDLVNLVFYIKGIIINSLPNYTTQVIWNKLKNIG